MDFLMKLFSLLTLLSLPVLHAQTFLTWDGGGDGFSFEDDANWLDFDTFGAPPAGTMANGNVIGYDEILIFAPFATIDINQSHNVNLGDGNLLTVEDAVVIAGNNASFHPIATGAGGSATVSLKGTSNFQYGWSWDMTWTLADSTVLNAKNSNSDADTGVLGKNSSLDFGSLDSRFRTSAINYVTTDPSALVAKMTVLGAPAVVGENLTITPDGSGGTWFTPVPEPSSALLLALGAIPLFRRNRK